MRKNNLDFDEIKKTVLKSSINNFNRFVESLKSDNIREFIGAFKNEYGEMFLVFKAFKNKPYEMIYIIGHETDWEYYRYMGNKLMIQNEFILTDSEEENIINLISKL